MIQVSSTNPKDFPHVYDEMFIFLRIFITIVMECLFDYFFTSRLELAPERRL